MIWGYHHFRKHPDLFKLCGFFLWQWFFFIFIPPQKKDMYHPKDHWTLKTGYFEDPHPESYRFFHPSIGGSKILRALATNGLKKVFPVGNLIKIRRRRTSDQNPPVGPTNRKIRGWRVELAINPTQDKNTSTCTLIALAS